MNRNRAHPTRPALARIVAVRDARPDEWDTAWHADPTATGFHSRFWAEAWRAGSGGRVEPRARITQFEDGAHAILLCSVQRLRRGLVRRTLSSPAGTYGGWISGDVLQPEHAAALARQLVDIRGSFVWRINPFNAHQASALKAMPATPEQTLVLDLEDGADGLARRWATAGNAVPQKARAARRAGVSVRPAQSLEDWRAYFEVYQATLERWGPRASSRYEWPLFAQLAAGDDGVRRLWLATVEDTVVAGALCFHGSRITSYWHGAARSEYFRARPVNLLMVEIAHDACARGHRWFDLGPSGGHEGVARFKRSLGATPLECPVVRGTSTAERVSRQFRRMAS